jgi:hypothetical protein
MVRRMPRALIRVLLAAASGAIVGVALLLLAYPPNRNVVLEMDRDLPPFLSSTYGVEREGGRTFVWTGSRAVLRLAGLDRGSAWTCTLHVRGPRDASEPSPDLTLSFDGVGGSTTRLGNEFQDVTIEVPARPDRAGLTLTANVHPTFRPGPSDPRELGAQIDWLRCTAANSWVWPPPAALGAAATSGAALGIAGALIAAPVPLVAAIVLLGGLGQAMLLARSGGVFASYPARIATFMTAAAALLALVAWAPAVMRRPRLSGAALVAASLSVVLAVLKLAALSHPAKALIDALFQAHRLEWVMAGRYFFTQPMPSGVQFPYAIGLYATAAPFAALITDHVLLLRTVVIVVEAIGGAMLYAVVARGFQDRVAGVVAVVLFHLVPVPFVVLGNANLTNAFAQAVGLIALCGLALMPVPARSIKAMAAAVGVGLLTTLAFLSHVGTIVVVAGILGTAVVTFLLARQRDLSRLAGFVVIMTTLAGLLATGLYYRHFTEVYEEAFTRMRSPAAASVAPPPVERQDGPTPAILVRPLVWHERVANSGGQTLTDIGWPLLALALVGGITRVGGLRGRVSLLLMAWAAAWVLFLVGGTLTRVEVQFQRYAVEFVARVNLAAYPVLAAAAALGVTWLWRRGRGTGLIACGLVAVVVFFGAKAWLGWSG